MNEFEKNIESQATFACEKIKDQCPFIKIINKKTFDQLDQQKQTFITQQEHITATINKLQTEIKSLNTTAIHQDDTSIKTLENEQKAIEKHIESIKSFLHEIAYQTIEKIYKEYTSQDKDLKELDKQISELEQEVKQIEEWKIQVQKAIIQKEASEKQIKDFVDTITKKELERKKLALEKEKIDGNTTTILEKNYLAMKQYHHDIDMLVTEFKQHQLERQKLEEQEKILGNLYTIFSKELLLIVIQEHLPVLNDIINIRLASIVDYQINLQLKNQ